MPHFYEPQTLKSNELDLHDFDKILSLKQHNMSTTAPSLQAKAAAIVQEYDPIQQNHTIMTPDSKLQGDASVPIVGSTETVDLKSRPPSPPSTGSTTPVLSIAPCPSRLQSVYPPVNYGVVEDGMIFRSAFPQDRNMDFMKSLKIKNVLCLVDTEPSESYKVWLDKHGVKRHRIDIAPNKEGKIKTSWDSLCQAVLLVMDPANFPLHIHCNQGKHRTGCVIACLRKVQRRPIEDVLREYVAYSSPKARPGDMELIRQFDPEAVYEYAKTHGYFTDRHFMRRMDSTISNIDGLAAALSTHSSGSESDELELTLTSTNSTFTDEGLEMQTDGVDNRQIVEEMAELVPQ